MKQIRINKIIVTLPEFLLVITSEYRILEKPRKYSEEVSELLRNNVEDLIFNLTQTLLLLSVSLVLHNQIVQIVTKKIEKKRKKR